MHVLIICKYKKGQEEVETQFSTAFVNGSIFDAHGQTTLWWSKLLLHVYIPLKTICTTKIFPQFKDIILNDFGAKDANHFV